MPRIYAFATQTRSIWEQLSIVWGAGPARSGKSVIILGLDSIIYLMKAKVWKLVLMLVYISLVIFQVKTTNIQQAYSFTPHKIDQQIQRMNMYPPSLARIGYILEVKREVQLLNKVVENFFFVVDPSEYFPNRLPHIFSPFLAIGLYLFTKERRKRKLIFVSFLTSIIILTLLGPHAKYGPVLIVPYFIFLIYLGLVRFVNLLSLRDLLSRSWQSR